MITYRLNQNFTMVTLEAKNPQCKKIKRIFIKWHKCKINTVNKWILSKLYSTASSIYEIKHTKCSPAKMTNHGWVKFLFSTWPGCNPHSKTTNPKNTTYRIHTGKRVKYFFPKRRREPVYQNSLRHTEISRPDVLTQSVQISVHVNCYCVLNLLDTLIHWVKKKQKDTVC